MPPPTFGLWMAAAFFLKGLKNRSSVGVTFVRCGQGRGGYSATIPLARMN